MSKIKLFEEFTEQGTSDGYISVPSDFEDRLQALKDMTQQRSEFYSIPINQIKVDLFYGIKWEIRDFLDYCVNKNLDEKTQEKYEEFLNSEIYDDESKSGVLAKYSGGKYENINKSDIPEVKSILWKYINEILPYDEVDYYYTYDLQGKLMTLLENFLQEIQEKGLFKVIK